MGQALLCAPLLSRRSTALAEASVASHTCSNCVGPVTSASVIARASDVRTLETGNPVVRCNAGAGVPERRRVDAFTILYGCRWRRF